MEEQLVVLVDPWRDKYDRLLEAHAKTQKLNQNLEEKLLKLAENHNAESTRLQHQIQELTQRLVEARLYIHQIEDENDRYRSDINVVVQLLHCKPSNFVSPKLDTLPDDLQRKVLGQRNGSNCKKEKKIIKVQVPTFPPTDIMYAVDKGKGKKNGEKDIVSAAIMAKILQERENERKENRKNRCKCASRIVLPVVDSNTQTLPVCTISYSDFNFSDFEEEQDPEDPEEEDDVDESEDTEEELQNPPYPHQNQKTQKTRTKTSTTISCSTTKTDIGCVSNPKSNKAKTLSCAYEEHHPPLLPYCTTIDDIMKTDQKEEELLPTPIFRRKERKPESLKSDGQERYQEQFTHKGQEGRFNKLEDQFTHNSNSNSNRHHQSVSAFPSPSSLSSASPVSSMDMAHSSSSVSGGSANEATHFLPEQGFSGPRSSSGFNYDSNPNSSRKLPGRPISMNFQKERERGWEKLSSADTYRNGLVSHWRTTVLVHHPPKSHSYEPLSLTSTTTSTSGSTSHHHHNHGEGSHQQTTFAATGTGSELLLDSPSDEQPLLHNYNNSHNNSNGNPSSTSAQYYRAQKRTFWTRSSSTTSTETEI